MKERFKRYGHCLFALYIFIYLPWFFYLESRRDLIVHTEIHCFLDDIIPFCEIFIIPYLLWFFYIVATCIYMYLKAERGEFLRFAFALVIGMTTSLIICQIFPNCVNLRPENLEIDGFLSGLIGGLYKADTSTNVFPSVHALNSLIACVALERNKSFKKHKILSILNITLCVSICLSTMFLKQHSALDVAGSLILYGILYAILYKPNWKWFRSKEILLP